MAKKILSLALALVMMLTIAIPVLAASEATVKDAVTASAKVAFVGKGATVEQSKSTKVTICYAKDGKWNATARCDGGFVYKCVLTDTLMIPSDITCEQESTIIAFFNTIVETVLNIVYGLIY